MKNIKILCLITSMLIGFTSCSNGQETEIKTTKKVLIVYLTRTQNTKSVAELIQQKTAGTLAVIEPVKPYPTHYKTMVDQVADENAKGFLPPIKLSIENINNYDTIFIGFPTWGMQLPPPIKSFLKQYSMKGKTVIPFNTNAGYGVGSGFDEIKRTSQEATILEGYSVVGGKERDGVLFVMKNEKLKSVSDEIDRWLKKIMF